jgi:hypothetical protein
METLDVGGTRCTSREALARFFEALTQRRQAISEAQLGPIVRRRTVTQRQRQSAEAGQQLAKMGV